MMERCAPLESSRKRRRKERKEKEKKKRWWKNCIMNDFLCERARVIPGLIWSYGHWGNGAAVDDGERRYVPFRLSLSLICRIDICVLILSLVLFSPLVHIFFLLLCAMGELGNHQRWLNQLYRGEVSQRVYPVSCEKNASSDAVSSLATLDIPLFFFHYLH